MSMDPVFRTTHTAEFYRDVFVKALVPGNGPDNLLG